ncbi:MAG: hypothetical protein ACHREM_17400 [Polyangiales bacterium]
MRFGRFAALLTPPLFALATFSREASAGGIGLDGLQALPPTGWFLPVGLNAGVAGLGSNATGALLGGELSVAHVPKDFGWWFGAYADGGYITGSGVTRFSTGPEVGLSIFGLDGGFVYMADHGQGHVGFCLRPMLTVGFVSVYGRWDHLLSGGGVNDGQLGVLLKFPIALEGQHY